MKVRTRLSVALLSATGCLTLAQSARAFDQLPTPAPPKNVNMKDVYKEPGPLGQPSKDALKAAVGFYLSGLANGKDLPDKKRLDLELVMNQVASEDGAATVSKEAMDLILKILNGNFPKESKINAMILLTELSEGALNARLPYGPAVNELYNYSKDEKAPAHLRSLALVGLDRHVRYGKTIKDPKSVAMRNSIAMTMTKIIASQPVDLAREDAHWWMVRRAYDVLLSVQAASEAAKDPLKTSEGLKAGIVLAVDQFTDPTQLTSIRYSAGTFLTRFDFATMRPAFRMRLFLGVAQFLDQEVVGWYEAESDKSKMMSGGMGMGGMGGGMGLGSGMGDMGGMMGGMMGGGAEGGESSGGMGGSMGGYEGGFPGGGGRGNNATGPKPIDTQSWDLRIARRKLNMYTQLSHALLKGTLAKDEKDYNLTGKGIMEAPLPDSHVRAGKFMIETLEEVQEKVNERTLTSVAGLMPRLITPLTKLRDAVELIPAYVEVDPKDPEKKEVEVVKSFKDFSPRMKSFKKADASGKLEATTKEAPAAGADGAPAAAADGTAAPAAGAPAGAPGAAPAAGAGGAAAPAGGAAPAGNAVPAGGAPVGGAPAGAGQANPQVPGAGAPQPNGNQ